MAWGPQEETKTGEVVRTLFENRESGYRVLIVLCAGSEETWVGVMPPVPAGQSVRATGKPEADKRRKGATVFRVSLAVPAAPDTTDGIVVYLGSGLISGVGKVLARRIVDRFGAETLTVLDKTPERLAEVDGIGPEKRKMIIESWAEHRAVADIMVFLHDHGASTSLATKIFAKYGPRAVEIIREQPYQLALDVTGIGFKTADRIARKSGIEPHNPARLMAGILQVLHDEEGNGHTYVERSDLLRKATGLLEVSLDAVTEALPNLAATGLAVIESIGSTCAIFRRTMGDGEAYIATRLRQISATRPRCKRLDAEAAIAAFEQQKGITLAPAQREAVRFAASHKVLVITGGPGSGKTTITRAIMYMLDKAKADVRLCAPTGRAAKRLSDLTDHDAMTIHRTLGFDKERRGFLHRRANQLPNCDAILIDETSMLEVPLASSLLDAVPDHARVIWIGDQDQLPSVGPGAVLRDLIDSGAVPVVRLTQVFRQAAGSPIIESAYRVNQGLMPNGNLPGHGGGFFIVPKAQPNEAADTAIKAVSGRIPDRFGYIAEQDVLLLTPMNRGDAGTIELNRRLQDALNPRSKAGLWLSFDGGELRRGDRVMQTKNDSDRDVYNGDIGFIEAVNPEAKKDEAALVVVFDDRRVQYEPKQVGALRLAYATTIHKSQGGQAKAVVIVLTMQAATMLARNLFYTAITRAEKLCLVVGDPKAIRMAIAETKKGRRRTLLSHRLRTQ